MDKDDSIEKLHKTLDKRISKIELASEKIQKIGEDCAHIPVVRTKIESMESHLNKLNGRVGKTEEVVSDHLTKTALQEKDIETIKKRMDGGSRVFWKIVAPVLSQLITLVSIGGLLYYLTQNG